MLERKLHAQIQRLLGQYPAVALVGPRQSGKTTLAKELPCNYFDMEQEPDKLKLDIQWNDIIRGEQVRGDQLVVLDEVQTYPDIFPRLRGTIDEERKRFGRFLLLGSVSPQLMSQVSESLAGRLAVLELTPFLPQELPDNTPLKNHWLYGGFPDGGILNNLNKSAYPTWQKSYLDLLAQRDLPNWGLSANNQTTQRLFSMLAASHSNEWNASQIGASMGLSYHTINSYLDYLEGAFLVRRLQPFHANIRKRLTKRPKVYWRDSGLLHAILNITNYEDLMTKPWVGASWEGYVIEQIINTCNSSGAHYNAWYLRSNDKYEIDLLLEFGSELWAIEIKLTTNPSPENFKKLNRAADLIGAQKRILISQNPEFMESQNEVACDLPAFLTRCVAAL